VASQSEVGDSSYVSGSPIAEWVFQENPAIGGPSEGVPPAYRWLTGVLFSIRPLQAADRGNGVPFRVRRVFLPRAYRNRNNHLFVSQSLSGFAGFLGSAIGREKTAALGEVASQNELGDRSYVSGSPIAEWVFQEDSAIGGPTEGGLSPAGSWPASSLQSAPCRQPIADTESLSGFVGFLGSAIG